MQATVSADSVTLTSYADVREALRHKDLREATHDEASFVIGHSLLTLHGEEHTQRRRVENRLFRRDTLRHYELDLLDGLIEETLRPYLAAGRGDVVDIAHRMVLNLAALAAGVDRPRHTPEETDRLHFFLMRFTAGATIIHSTRDHAEIRREVLEGLVDFETEFYRPSVELRRELLRRFEAGEIAEDELPKDILTILLRNQAALGISDEVIRNEICLYLVAASHTSANQATHSVHQIFEWIERHPEDADKPYTDLAYLQRCMHESVRVNPPSPVLMRQAPQRPVTLRSGTIIPENVMIAMDLTMANRDQAIFGADADQFNPGRTLPGDVFPWGLSFGAGTHACIGQELAAGQPQDEATLAADHLFGTVTRLVSAMLDAGMRPDPSNPPTLATHTVRREWGTYPVVFARQ